MLTLINSNRMRPLIAPIGLDYVATAARREGIVVEVLDLGLASDADSALVAYFARAEPALVGVSFRNVDDCFWPSATSFVAELSRIVARVRDQSTAPIVLGGVGFSVFAQRLVAHTGADYGLRGDGEQAIASLYRAVEANSAGLEDVPGLVWRNGGQLVANRPAWPVELHVPSSRDAIDNSEYFRRGGQGGVETKRGCPRRCIYCADPVSKGALGRMRRPTDVADEFGALLNQGVDVIHLCDGEFNVPRAHALAVCEELTRRRMGDRVKWYAYASVVPFDDDLASAMRRAGCVGIDFTGDSGSNTVLSAYAQTHTKEDLARSVRLCKENEMTCMVDLLLGGPGETPSSVAETIAFMKEIGPDCVGAPLGMRLYDGTPAAAIVASEGPLEENRAVRRKYEGPVDLLKPTFYISASLGDCPARLVRDLIAGDERFFPPNDDDPASESGGDHNYNENRRLHDAIAKGARGAYWDILRQRTGA
jgi:tryptophan 2-C-methyltransferase